MAHEYTHSFADTEDYVFGYYACQTLITTAQSIDNADSFGFYIQNIYDTKGK